MPHPFDAGKIVSCGTPSLLKIDVSATAAGLACGGNRPDRLRDEPFRATGVLSSTSMFRPNSIAALLSLAPVLQTPALSQEASCIRRTLPLSAADSQGVPIEGLGATDLQTRFRVGPLKILSIVPDDRPHRIVILVDASGTIATK